MSRFQPEPVSSLSATVVGCVCTLNWVNGDGGSNGGCRIERTIPVANSDANSVTNYVTLALVAAGVTSYVDSTIQFGSAYAYRVTTLPESDAPMLVPDAGVGVTATTTGTQPHLDTSRPNPAGMGSEFSYKPFVVLNGASAHPQANVSQNTDPPTFPVNGIPFNS